MLDLVRNLDNRCGYGISSFLKAQEDDIKMIFQNRRYRIPSSAKLK